MKNEDGVDSQTMCGNHLLAMLDEPTRVALAPQMQHIPLVIRERMYENDEPLHWAYFPLNGVISMVAELGGSRESLVEVATVGNEGMVGLPIFLGAERTPGFAFAQVTAAPCACPPRHCVPRPRRRDR